MIVRVRPKAIKAVYISNAREFLRDAAAVGFTIIFPLVLAVFFSFILGGTPGFTIDYYLPNMLGVSLMWMGLFATAQPLVEQRERQIFRRMAVTPISRADLLLGQVLFRVSVAVGQALIFLLVGRTGFGVKVVGSWFLLLSAIVLGSLIFVSLGYFLAGLASSQEAVPGISQPINMVMMFLSGTLLPAAMLPQAVRWTVRAVPLTYVADALRQLITGVPPMYPIATNFLVMGIWIIALFGLAIRFFRWE